MMWRSQFRSLLFKLLFLFPTVVHSPPFLFPCSYALGANFRLFSAHWIQSRVNTILQTVIVQAIWKLVNQAGPSLVIIDPIDRKT